MYQAVKDVNASYDALGDLFEIFENFINRLDIYTRMPPSPVMNEIIVKILVELLSTLAKETKEIKRGRLCESIPVCTSFISSSKWCSEDCGVQDEALWRKGCQISSTEAGQTYPGRGKDDRGADPQGRLWPCRAYESSPRR